MSLQTGSVVWPTWRPRPPPDLLSVASRGCRSRRGWVRAFASHSSESGRKSMGAKSRDRISIRRRVEVPGSCATSRTGDPVSRKHASQTFQGGAYAWTMPEPTTRRYMGGGTWQQQVHRRQDRGRCRCLCAWCAVRPLGAHAACACGVCVIMAALPSYSVASVSASLRPSRLWPARCAGSVHRHYLKADEGRRGRERIQPSRRVRRPDSVAPSARA